MPNKPPSNWLLLRGLTRESQHWGGFKEQLQNAYPESRIYTTDFPGTGVFYKDKSPKNIPEIRMQIHENAQREGCLETPVNLLAVSMGGMIGLDWIKAHPQEINLGVLINVSMGGMNPFYQRLRWQCYPQLASIFLQPDVYKREWAIIKLISNREELYDDLAKDWYRIQAKHPVSLRNAFFQLIAAARYQLDNQIIKTPILLLNSLKR